MFKVMIVDDVEVLRTEVKRLKLWGEATGFIIEEEAADGLDALKKLESNSIDLIITDIRMPNMDGIDLLRIVSEKKLCPVTVLLSDFTEYSYARQGFLYGAFDYLSKPIDDGELAKLLIRIKNHLNEKQYHEQKLLELQGIAEMNLFTADDIRQIMALIQTGDHAKAVSFFSNLIDKIGVHYDSDQLKTLIAMQNAVHEIIDETRKTHSWIEKYIDLVALRAIDYSDCINHEEMKKMTKDVIEKLTTVVNRLIGNHNNKVVRQVCEYALMHIEEDISVKILSEKLFINKSYLSEIFKQKFGTTLLEYITIVKMERAKKLLQEGNLKKYQIAERLGYNDNGYFGRLFKKYTGTTLKEYSD